MTKIKTSCASTRAIFAYFHQHTRVLFPILHALLLVMFLATIMAAIAPRKSTHIMPVAGYEHEIMAEDQLSKIATIEDALKHLEALSPRNDTEFAVQTDNFLRRRFSHGYSEYQFTDNWLAYLSGYFWADLRNPVDPGDILNYRFAGCSQQALVFQELLQRRRIQFVSVGFIDPGHFALAAKLDGKWRYFDTDLEPKNDKLVLLSEVLDGTAILAIYGGKLGAELRSAALSGKAWTMHQNEFPAWQAYIFHKTTWLASHLGWALIAFGLWLLRRSRSDAGTREP